MSSPLESDYPRATILLSSRGKAPRVFLGETELEFEVWRVTAEDGYGEPVLTIRLPVAGLEFKRID